MFHTYDSYSAIILCEFPALLACVCGERSGSGRQKRKGEKDGFLSSSFSLSLFNHPQLPHLSSYREYIYIYIYI